MWKGELKVGSATIPVKLYAAVDDHKLRFNVLQKNTKTRVRQQITTEDNQSGGALSRLRFARPVEKEQIRKGYEIEPGTFVILEPEELQRLKPKESRQVTFTRFVPVRALGPEWYERPYYLGPDGNAEKYFALVQALSDRQVLGIAQWTMRGKSYIGALQVEDVYLVLNKLRYAEEVLSARELPSPGGRQLESKELRMAEELVSALEGEFDPEQFRNEYRERLMHFIEEKAKGKHPRLPAVKERRAAGSLDEQLAKSLAAMKRGREKKVA